MPANHVPPRIAATRLGVSTKTLERWLDEGKIKAIITPGGQRRYDLDSIIPPDFGFGARKTVLYARASSAQKPDLVAQIGFLQSRYPGCEVIQDIGSGLNYKRKGFLALLERILSDDVGLVVIASDCAEECDLLEVLCSIRRIELCLEKL